MAVEVFDNGDKPYRKWIQNNPVGFVLNTGQGSKSRKTFLHLSRCTHLQELAHQP
jgi:hypothetical protein